KAGNQTVREIDLGRDQSAMTAAVAKTVAPPAPAPQIVEKPAAPAHGPEMPALDKPQLLNGVHCVLEYALDVPNATKVEGYATKDGGKTWLRLGEDADKRSPFEFELPGDGTYGLMLVVSTAGHSAQPPAAGDTPDWWVEIDTGKPSVQMTDVRLGVGDETGQLIL